MKKLWKYAALLFFLLLGTALGLLILTPPRVPAKFSSLDFSVQNQINHIKNIAQKPHPLGSSEHAKVRNYILKELNALGLEAQVQKAASVRLMGPVIWVAEVQNIVARLKGTQKGKALLIMTHYDSVPGSPGANDDSSGVGSILEILRAFQAREKRKNDVIALFSDAEELALLGAKAFYEEHPWAHDVGLVLNIEARGSKGVTFMFETSGQNKWLLKALNTSTDFPVATSIAEAAYKKMPGDSDFTIFRDAGLPGMNFAYGDGVEAYHKSIDDLEHISIRTLYHQGKTIFDVANFISNADLSKIPAGKSVYFNILPGLLIVYPKSLVWSFTTFVGLLLVGIIAFGFFSKKLTYRGLLLGFTGLAIAGVAGVCSISGLWKLLGLRYGELLGSFFQFSDVRNTYSLGLVFMLVSVFLLLYGILARIKPISDLFAGALLWWLLGMLGLSIFFPEASYVLTWPLLFGSLSLLIVLSLKDENAISFGKVLILGLLSIPGMLIMIPLFQVLNIAFSIKSIFFGIPALLLGLMIPFLAVTRKNHIWRFAGVPAFTGFMIIIFGLSLFKPDQKPRSNSLIYYLNAASREAFLGVSKMDAWASQFMKKTIRENLSPSPGMPIEGVYKTQAQIINLAPPKLVLLEESKSIGNRTLKLRLSSPRKASEISLYIKPKYPFVSMELSSQATEYRPTKKFFLSERRFSYGFRLEAFGLKEEGIELTLAFEGDSRVEFEVLDLSYDLPGQIQLRQAPKQLSISRRTYVTKSYIY